TGHARYSTRDTECNSANGCSTEKLMKELDFLAKNLHQDVHGKPVHVMDCIDLPVDFESAYRPGLAPSNTN
ncbi:MAG: hypothetical protein WCJ75_18015, partial [Desulfomonile sp.]